LLKFRAMKRIHWGFAFPLIGRTASGIPEQAVSGARQLANWIPIVSLSMCSSLQTQSALLIVFCRFLLTLADNKSGPPARIMGQRAHIVGQQLSVPEAELDAPPAAVRFQAVHSNECWQFALSPSDLKQIKEPR